MYGRCVKECRGNECTTYHRIPKIPAQRKKWLDFLNLPYTTNGRVCSNHFQADDFEVKRDGTVWLKRFACPIPSNEPIEFSDEVEVGVQDVDMMGDASNEVRLDVNFIYEDHNYAKPTFKQSNMAFNNRLLIANIRRNLKSSRKQMKDDDENFHSDLKTTFRNDEYDKIRTGSAFIINATMDGMAFTDDTETDCNCDNEYEENDSVIDDESTYLMDDYETDFNQSTVDEGETSHRVIDLKGADDIMKKYFGLIKRKDKGGLFYPSDSLYRIAILADVVFTTAVKESGGRFLKKTFNLNRLVGLTHSICLNYSDVLFHDLKYHFEIEDGHESALIRNIAKFYMKIRIDYLNKSVSANSGKRQKVLHSIHFQGM